MFSRLVIFVVLAVYSNVDQSVAQQNPPPNQASAGLSSGLGATLGSSNVPNSLATFGQAAQNVANVLPNLPLPQQVPVQQNPLSSQPSSASVASPGVPNTVNPMSAFTQGVGQSNMLPNLQQPTLQQQIPQQNFGPLLSSFLNSAGRNPLFNNVLGNPYLQNLLPTSNQNQAGQGQYANPGYSNSLLFPNFSGLFGSGVVQPLDNFLGGMKQGINNAVDMSHSVAGKINDFTADTIKGATGNVLDTAKEGLHKMNDTIQAFAGNKKP